MKRIMILAAAAVIASSVAIAEETKEKETMETVVIMTTNRGEIAIRFFPEAAPEHVKNFIALSKDGTYEGTLFHRIIPGFMVQGGDPNSKDGNPGNDGTGGITYKGEGTTLKAEFNDIKHERGILSMARSQSPDSARSQFFMMHQSYPSLDGQYTVFGQIIDGIEVVDLIVGTPRSRSDRPDEDQKILKMVVEEWETDKVNLTRDAMWEEERIAEEAEKK